MWNSYLIREYFLEVTNILKMKNQRHIALSGKSLITFQNLNAELRKRFLQEPGVWLKPLANASDGLAWAFKLGRNSPIDRGTVENKIAQNE